MQLYSSKYCFNKMNRFTPLITALFFSLLAGSLVSSCQLLSNGKVSLNVSEKPFELLSDYHFFKDDLKALIPNEKVLPYDLASALFSDYAHKARFIFVPQGKAIAYQDKDVLNLPVGSCYIKNFYYPFDFRDEKKGRRIIETRLLVHREAGWEALDYIWNDEQTDATLDVAGDVKQVSWIHTDGSKKSIDYIIPNKNQCKGCHWSNGNSAIMPIGPKARNLNHEYTYVEGKKNQLTKWKEVRILTGLPDLKQCPDMPDYTNASADLNLRARAYLDINCAHCHSADGPAYTSGLYLNYDSQDQEHLGICKTPVAAGRGTGNLLYDILPGKPEESILHYRMKSDDAGIRMPEVGRSQLHKEGLDLIAQWIALQKGACGTSN